MLGPLEKERIRSQMVPGTATRNTQAAIGPSSSRATFCRAGARHRKKSTSAPRIGVTVMTGAFAVGGVSGGAFNPAVATGITVMGLSLWSYLWVLLAGEAAGALAAAAAYRLVNGGD